MGIFFTIVFIAIVAFAVYKYATKSDPLNKADQRPKSQSEEPVTFYKMGATSIIDLIDLDLRSMPDEYSVLESEEDGAKHYIKSLPHKQFGIFDSLTTIVTKSGTMNFIFRTKRDDVRQGQIEKLVNTIYVMYGKDSMGDGVFSQKDIDDLKADFFDRRWHDAKIPVAVSEDEGLFEMTIWSNFISRRPEDGKVLFRIKGTNYRKEELSTGTFLARLVPEEGNEHDPFAVQVVSMDGKVLGYFPAGNEHLFSVLKQNGDTESLPVTAEITESISDSGHRVLTGFARLDTSMIKNLNIALLKI